MPDLKDGKRTLRQKPKSWRQEKWPRRPRQRTHTTKTIAADHNQKSFKHTLKKFMRVRISAAIISQGRKKKASNAAFFALFEKEYGVPAGVIVAILGTQHGRLGHTQFLRGNALKYEVDAYDDGKVDFYNLTDSLASTANLLRGRGGNAAKVI